MREVMEKTDNNNKLAKAQKLLSKLTKAVFWNCNIDKFDCSRDRDYIIKRIIEAGLEEDEIIMWKLYSYEDIKRVALNIEYLERDHLIYMAFVLKVNEKYFKSYGKKPWYHKK